MNWEDSFKIGGHAGPHVNQAILGIEVYLAVHNEDNWKELQKGCFHVFAAAIPEAGFRAPKSGFRDIKHKKSCDVSLWKINKNKENLVGATGFGMVTNLHCGCAWTHSE